MATFTVTTAADRVDAGDGALSLREAVARANASAGADTILFAGALEGRTLTLTEGQLAVAADITIDGDRNDDGDRVTLDGNQNGRVLAISGGGGTDVVLDDLVITGGRVVGQNGGGILLGAGNGLALTQCTVRGNDTNSDIFEVGDGGGIYAEAGGRLTITASTLSGNSASWGGAIALAEGSSLELTRSVVRGNSAGSYHAGAGGGIHATGSEVRVTASTLVGNSGYYEGGGGILARDSFVQFTRSTIAGNSTGARLFDAPGGGIRAEGGVLDLVSSTVTGNRAEGVYADNPGGGIAVTAATDFRLANSIVLGNSRTGDDGGITNSSDVSGTIDRSNGHNILGGGAPGAEGDVVASPGGVFAAIDPVTRGGLLAANGGPTPTVALRDALDNPALSGGEPAVAGGADQRGFASPRPAASNPDVGAFELDQTAISRAPSANNDVLTGTAAADTLAGRGGADLLLGQAGNDTLNGDAIGDTLRGGLGNDALNGGGGQDTASYRDAGGPVTVSLAAGTATGALGRDTLAAIENLEGGGGGDRLTGDDLVNTLGGASGADRLFGRGGDDALLGALGNDRLAGALGRDTLTGGAGADLFDYDRLADSPVGANRDLILDFAQGADRIDLTSIDANGGVAGDQAFRFLGAGPLTGGGQLRFAVAGARTVIQGSADGDAAPEFEVQLAGRVELGADDFLL
jgi:Ca2+-binding RTX toxin-like protein